MIFTLEALEAKKGDALLLHYGSDTKPSLIVIDGGPGGVYNKTLSPRLMEIKKKRFPNDPLPIRMVMVSHMDDDHINGILQMMQKLNGLKERRKQLPFDVVTLWHNAFDDVIGNDADEISGRLNKAVKAASKTAAFPADMPVKRHTAMVLASVNQGRNLRITADKLGLTVNEKFGNLVMVPEGKGSKRVSLGNNLTFTVIGPLEHRVVELQEEWNKQIKKKGLAKTAEFADKSVFNLASIIVVAKCGGKTMLLTGDARGDDIEQGLKAARMTKRGKAHFDLLKMPHHGSDNNVTTDFFRNVTADHYVVSGNGKHGNPEIATFQMLSEARGNDKFTIHVTNEEPRLKRFFATEKRRGKKYTVKFRKTRMKSISVDLL